MNIPLPPANNTFASSATTTQRSSVPLDESMLSNDGIGALLKGIVLRWRVGQIIKSDEDQQIVTGVKIIDMQHNDASIVNHNSDTEQFAASINKLPVALLVLQDLRASKLHMDQVLTWVPSDRRDGGGIYDAPNSPTQASLQDVLFDMLNRSGNTAVRILVNYALGQAPAVNARWGQIPQLSHTYLQPLDNDPSRFYLGNTTPHDSLWTMEQLMSNQDTYGQFVKHALATNIYTDIGTRSQLAGNDYIVLVNKLGLLDDPTGDNRHDVGIIYNTKTHKSYGYAYMTTSPESNTNATPTAEQSLKDMGHDVLLYAGDKPKSQTSPVTPMQQFAPQHGNAQKGKLLY